MPLENSICKDDPQQDLLISYLSLRKAIGILGVLLPFILVIGVFTLSECKTIRPTISDYYYTGMGHVFVAILCAVGLFLFTYKGYEIKDMIASKLACVFALAVSFFPTYGPDPSNLCNFLHRNSTQTVSTVHDISAASLFITFAYFCLFLFVKTSGNPTPQKIKRNKIYRVCGYTILASILMVLLYSTVKPVTSALSSYKPIFIFETIALWAFGFSWLTKGEFILRDE